MTDYTARNVLLKDANGNYLIPYTEKADLSLSNLNATGEAHFQAPLVSGTNIKTINGSSVLGSGDLTVTATITGGASTIVTDNLTASKALVSDSSGKVAVSSVTNTELEYLSGVTSAIQTQINDKANTNLSNLSVTGEAHFANPDLSNLSVTGQAVIDGKADVDAGNFNTTGKKTIVGWGMPDYSAGISISRTALLSGYTAPKKGVIMGRINPTGYATITVNDAAVVWGGDEYGISCYIPLNAGDIAKITAIDSSNNNIIFYPCKGV